jgi:hypothetical protein
MEGAAKQCGVLGQILGLSLAWHDGEHRPSHPTGAAGQDDGAQRRWDDGSTLEHGYEVVAESIEEDAERGRHRERE